MSARSLDNWWRRHSNADRVEMYTRWSLCSFGLAEVVLAATLVGAAGPGWAAAALLALYSAHALTVAVCCHHSLNWLLGRRTRPHRWQAATAATTTLLAATLLGVRALDRSEDPSVFAALLALALANGMMALLLHVPALRSVGLVLLLCLGVGMAVYLVSGSGLEAVAFAVACASGTLGLALTGRVSAWMLGVMLELDAGRHAQARLAVAEERLRFGRDLHDVLGRNLTVIALKSELAVQLAQRGRPEAVAQMVEVQEVTRQSQRELRDVVRGYREAGLRNELAGAGSVLRAAGIDCVSDAERVERLPAAAQSALGWVVREATTNVLRHSDASRCEITLRITEDGAGAYDPGADGSGEAGGRPAAAVLAVRNNGARGNRTGGGSGLAGLRERLAGVGGTLTTTTGSEDGEEMFVLRATVPLNDGAPAREPAGVDAPARTRAHTRADAGPRVGAEEVAG
ncbi:sensor histidine kinase [Streptomyces durbertensis]|uniref:Sensor histidine kinase n=1 Tax=Streptomyces durbertensis TaxID=2448886 RepID=A0ABR6EFJ2_9ACTN|nr:histidine kinase [Streptomyces durbertensis]MBB1243735.1 sensor histidine kinase [Streptomyces durbertensis]